MVHSIKVRDVVLFRLLTIQDFECNGVQTGDKQRIGDTNCITGTNLARSIWISQITKEVRHICLRRFNDTGCMSEDTPQQLVIRE